MSRFQLNLLDGHFDVTISPSADWNHVVLNYIGPENRQGIQVYLDGLLTGSDSNKTSGINSPGDGRVVVERSKTDRNGNYTFIDVDELLFFNEKPINRSRI